MSKRFDQRDVARICDQLGVRHGDGTHLDAGETAFLLRQLEYIEQTLYETKYPALLALQFVPLKAGIPIGAQSWTYRMWDSFGQAKIIHSYADDLPMIGRLAKEVNQPIRSLGASYGYSIQDIRAALFAGVPLDQDLALATRRAMETFCDELLSVGSETDGIAGFLNHPNLTNVDLPTGSWDSADSLDILADLHFLANSIRIASKQIFAADTMLFDQDSWSIVTTKPMSDFNPKTVLATFLDQSESVKNASVWWRCDTAASGNPAVVCYARSPEVIEAICPQLFETFPPQPDNLTFKIPCHMRCGGTSTKYPLGMCFTDDQ